MSRRFRQLIEQGVAILDEGGSALDAVIRCVTLLEDDPLYNAGRGSVLNADGIVDCDASIMDGRTLDAGAIAGVRGVRNPVLLARVKEKQTVALDHSEVNDLKLSTVGAVARGHPLPIAACRESARSGHFAPDFCNVLASPSRQPDFESHLRTE